MACGTPAVAFDTGGVRDAVRHLTRELVDPTSPSALEDLPSSSPDGEIPLEFEDELRKKFLEHHYSDWSEIPVPMLSDRTPLEAVKTSDGRRKVIELLRLYEHGEAKEARETGVEPFDFSFLWRSVGLDPDEHR